MKLLIATDCFLPRWDGIARFLHELLPHLTKTFDVSVIAPEFPGKPPKVPKAKLHMLKTWDFQIGDYSPPKLNRRLIKEQVKACDMIFSQTLGPIGAYAVMQGASQKKKVVSFIHSLEWELFARSVTTNRALRRSVHHITKTFVRRIYGRSNILLIPSPRISPLLDDLKINTAREVVRLGINTSAFSPGSKVLARKKLRLKPKRKIIGYAGRIGREKDIPTLLKAYEEIKKKRDDIDLLIVGSGIKEYDKEMEDLGVHRFPATDRIIDYLRAMDVYVLTSLTETSSLSTMEAMSAGVPVFVTGTGETRIYVKDGKNGFRFRKGAYRQLSRQILSVIDNPKTLEKLGKLARKTIVHDYPWKSTVKSIVEIIEQNQNSKD